MDKQHVITAIRGAVAAGVGAFAAFVIGKESGLDFGAYAPLAAAAVGALTHWLHVWAGDQPAGDPTPVAAPPEEGGAGE